MGILGSLEVTMKRRTTTVGRFMVLIVPVAVTFWLARPAVTLYVNGVGSHSHPPPEPGPIKPGESPDHHMRLYFRPVHNVHPDPFWPQYVRLLMGSSWPGDYRCPLVPPGTAEERPAWRGIMVSANEY
jgi:hypothetical protein